MTGLRLSMIKEIKKPDSPMIYIYSGYQALDPVYARFEPQT